MSLELIITHSNKKLEIEDNHHHLMISFIDEETDLIESFIVTIKELHKAMKNNETERKKRSKPLPQKDKGNA